MVKIMLGCEYLHDHASPSCVSHRPFVSQGGWAAVVESDEPRSGWKEPRRGPGGDGGKAQKLLPHGEAGGKCSSWSLQRLHLQGVAPWPAPWQCSVLRWGRGGSVSLLMCRDRCPWAWQPGSQPFHSPATSDYYWVHCPRGRHTTQLSKQPANLLEIPFTVCFYI